MAAVLHYEQNDLDGEVVCSLIFGSQNSQVSQLPHLMLSDN